jgi:uroporphyrinogen-III decarboxylase
MRAVLSGELPDRVPFFPTIFTDHACLACDRSFEESIVDPAVGQRCMLGAALRYETDVVRFLMGPPASWYEEKHVCECDGKMTQFLRKSGQLEGHYDVAGGGFFVPLEKQKPIRSLSEVAEIPVPTAEEYLQRGYLKDVAPLVKEAKEKGLFTVGMCGKQTIGFMVDYLGGTEPALMSFYDDPELAKALIAKGVAHSVERGKAFIEIGVDCIYIGDSYASGSVISPDIFRNFCVPAYREAAQEFHRLGVFCYQHCCGNYNPLLDAFVEIGVDAMDGLDPTSGMSVRRTKEKIGDRVTLMGGISCLTLLGGTPEQVYEEAKTCIMEGKPGGRYVLGSACAVPRKSPPKNLLVAKRAAVDFGHYG